MDKKPVVCPDCGEAAPAIDRRGFLRAAAAAPAALGALPLFATPKASAASPTPKSAAETAVKGLYDTLTDEQKKVICFDWDYVDTNEKTKRGLLRTFVSNNWQVTDKHIDSDFYTKKQKDIIHDVFKGVISPEWYKKVLKQLKDDTENREWGAHQSIAIFGKPGDGKFQMVMTGRHMTLRADGNSESHVAFGGPLFYGHAASGFTEKVGHPNNVYWPQALAANKVFRMLDDKQQKKALVEKMPRESAVPFQGEKGKFTGLAVSEMTADQKKEVENVLILLLEHYRTEDRDEVRECLKKLGGLDKCHLTFYQEDDLGDDQEWDSWRLEGPAFVWHFRGTPHVHVWVNIADDPSVKLNARG